MVGAQHDAHLDEPCGILGQLSLEPQQADDIPYIVVPCDQSAHSDSIVRRLLPSVITDAADHSGGHPHLQSKATLKLPSYHGLHLMADGL